MSNSTRHILFIVIQLIVIMAMVGYVAITV